MLMAMGYDYLLISLDSLTVGYATSCKNIKYCIIKFYSQKFNIVANQEGIMQGEEEKVTPVDISIQGRIC